MTVFELITPVLHFIKQNNNLMSIEEEYHNYDLLTRNTPEAKIDFVI